MDRSTELGNLLAALEARRQEIGGQHQAAIAELSAARRALSAEAETVNELAAAQARVSALEAAQKSLGEEIGATRTRYEAALHAEREAARSARLEQVRAELKRAREGVEAARARANDALATETAAILKAVERHQELGAEEAALTGSSNRGGIFHNLNPLTFGHAIHIAWTTAAERQSAANRQALAASRERK